MRPSLGELLILVLMDLSSGYYLLLEVLKECLNYLRERDQLVITRLDRLARSVLDITQINHELEQRHIDLVVIDQHIDTSTTTGKLMFNMLGAILPSLKRN